MAEQQQQRQRQLVKRADQGRGYDLVTDAPVLKPGRGEILLRVSFVGICGSDTNLFNWNATAESIATRPFTPGHEACGTIEERGSDVSADEYPTGALAAVENHFFCGECFQCRHDQRHICARMDQYGHGRGTPYGGFAELTIVPARFLYVLRNQSLPPQLACALEPFGVAHHAVELAEVKGESLLVTGCGPIGLMAIGIARAYGARIIIASDTSLPRLELAKRMGATTTCHVGEQELADIVEEATRDDGGVGRLVECSGFVLDTVWPCLRKGGRAVLLGIPKKAITIEDPLKAFLFRSLTVHTIHGRRIFHDWKISEALLHEKKVDISPLLTHEFGLAQFEEAHAMLASGEGCKILVNPMK